MSSFRRKIKNSLERTGDSMRQLAKSTSNNLTSGVDRMLDRRVCLGVTGFSGSGKTTMITSLVHQLCHYPNAALAAFPPALQERLLGVEVRKIADSLPSFPYQSGIDFLSRQEPEWPNATREETGCLLELKYRSRSSLLPRSQSSVGRLFIEIRDYPGEWLLDLPLLDMSYADWCRQFHSQFCDGKEGLDELTSESDFIKQICQLSPHTPLSASGLQALWLEQAQFLTMCREQKSLTMIQPGRLIHAGPDSPESQHPFIPLPQVTTLTSEQLQSASENSLYRVCERNYHHYLDTWVKPFYRNTFQKVDRQLVLVDVLRGLNGGPDSLEDLRLSMAQVLQSFDYGRNSVLRRLISPRIDRVVFSASKIDQVLPDQHENVRSLTAALVRDAQRRATFSEIDVRCEAVAAVRSTTTVDYQGQPALKGLTDSGPGLVRHPAIPDHLPSEQDWQELGQWQMRRLLPPKGLQLPSGGNLPHIRLDTVINDLLGDKFQ